MVCLLIARYAMRSHVQDSSFLFRNQRVSLLSYALFLANTTPRPSADYDKVSGSALDAVSTYSGRSVVSFGKAIRTQPKTHDFIFMSAPPTSAGQRHMYLPNSPGSSGMHAHNGFGGGSSIYSTS